MKRVLLVVFIAGLFNFNANAGDKDKMVDGGLYLGTGLFMPSSKYFTVDYPGFDGDVDGTNFGVGGLFQLGQVFAITQLSDFGIGVKVTWVELGIAFDNSSIFNTLVIFQNSIKAGPQFSYLINDDMAIDVYYQFAPTFVMIADEDDSELAFGITHALGIAYRWKILSIGIENGFGEVKLLDNNINPLNIGLRTNNIKLIVGVQF